MGKETEKYYRYQTKITSAKDLQDLLDTGSPIKNGPRTDVINVVPHKWMRDGNVEQVIEYNVIYKITLNETIPD